MPWRGGSLVWSTVPCTKRLLVQFLIRAHAWAMDLIPGGGTYGSNQSMFLSLSLPLSLKSIKMNYLVRIKK